MPPVLFASSVLLMAAAKEKEKKPIEASACSGHITNLKESILETFNIYDKNIATLEVTMIDRPVV